MRIFRRDEGRHIIHHNIQLMPIQLTSRLSKQAKQAYKSKNTKQALAMFKKIYKKYSKNSQIAYFIGSCYLNEGDFEAALNYFKECLQIDSYFNKNIYIFMAICYKSQNKFKNAVSIISEALQKYPRFKDGYFYKGKMHIKLQQFQAASQCFRKCIKIQPNSNDLSYLMLGDCLRNLGKYHQALQNYNIFSQASPNNFQKATLRKIGLLLEMKCIKEAQVQIQKAKQKGVQSNELIFLKGICQYQLRNYSQAITCFQFTLSSNFHPNQTAKALEYLIQINIKEKDFFGAEHLILRSKFMNVRQTDFVLYCKLVEGINDLIKRKLEQCEQKLECVYTASAHKKGDAMNFLFQASFPYYAFCLFCLQKYEKALGVYKISLRKNREDGTLNIEKYNQLICESIILHKRTEFKEAELKLKEASRLIPDKVQPIFLLCINNVLEFRKNSENEESSRKALCQKLNKLFQEVQKAQSANSLFLFYQSLALLFQNKDACETIQKAISISEQEVSEYFFIKALAYSLSGQHLKGLEAITKAIELDQSIPEFYKQRSKYYYVLERYDDAVTDIVKVLDETNDEEAKHLLTFYYYMTGEYTLSLALLNQVSQHNSDGRFKEFETALNFRISQFQKCGAIGIIINAIIHRTIIDESFIEKNIKIYINQKQAYSQFTVYHFHLILSAYYFYKKDSQRCLEQLFESIEQIQTNFESEQQFTINSQKILNEIKFNITMACLLKQSKEIKQNKLPKFIDTCKYIEMFISQTQEPDFIFCMKQLNRLIIECSKQTEYSNEIINHIQFHSNETKISNLFPQIQIELKKNRKIKTKFLMAYPQKLKFNIAPQFDESFLFNFDIQKVESKLCPPWFKLHNGKIFFTDKIRNQSVLISQTSRGPTPSLVVGQQGPQNLRQKFKLDDIVQKKLQRIMKAREKNSRNRSMRSIGEH